METRSRAASTGVMILLLLGLASLSSAQLSVGFYDGKCGRRRSVEAIVFQTVKQAFLSDRTICASLIRLHFHDCFVQGCDGSVLLDTADSEKNSPPNKNSIRGFEVIDSIKAALEKRCPGLVSCADILALAARDCVRLEKGEFYALPTGRFDGLTSGGVQGPLRSLPAPFHDIATLKSIFSGVGLDSTDLVVLSGLHTTGRARCLTITSRLYDASGNPIQDPNFTPARSDELRAACPFGGDGTVKVPMDPTPLKIDTLYFKGIITKQAFFGSDNALLNADDTSSLVNTKANARFFSGVGKSMVKMGNINPVSQANGQVRNVCNAVNA